MRNRVTNIRWAAPLKTLGFHPSSCYCFRMAQQAALAEKNRLFYNHLWRGAQLCEPDRFNTWPLISELLDQSQERLEIGPGLRPRLPIADSEFIDLSEEAVEKLNARGGKATLGNAARLPYASSQFDLVCAFDILEHIEEQEAVFREINRVLKPGGTLLFSVPLHPDAWSAFDEIVGHHRRYAPDELKEFLGRFGFTIEASTGFGMKPRNRFLSRLGLWWLKTFPEQALYYYNKYIFPIGLKNQPKLQMEPGLADTAESEGIVVRARKSS